MSGFFKRRFKGTVFVLAIAFASSFIMRLNYGDSVPAVSMQNDSNAYFKGNDGISLTFNIGWGDENADKILDVLEKKEFKNATFFLSGAWMERHQHVIERITDLGYEIGILGYDYVDYTDMDEQDISRDINKALEVCKKYDIEDVKLMRTPTGEFNETTAKVAKQQGLTLVQWSIDTHDWENPGADKIIESVAQSEKGDIVLLHASDSALQTAKALPKIIDFVEMSGLKSLKVSEMISGGSSTTEEVQ